MVATSVAESTAEAVRRSTMTLLLLHLLVESWVGLRQGASIYLLPLFILMDLIQE